VLLLRRFKKTLIWLHKWLGIALALFFLMWFGSGVVLYFVPFPNLTHSERLQALPPLELSGTGCCLTAEAAAQQAQFETFTQARLGMHDGRAVWRLLGRRAGGQPEDGMHWHTVDARTAAVLPRLSIQQAAAVAERFSARRASHTEILERDQWTVPQGLNPYRPLAKVTLAGDDGLQLYVSLDAAEVVRDTRRSERFWNWLGAVPHWIYPTILRQAPRVWHHVVVWLSIPGVLLVASGLVLGIWQLFLNRTRWIPYRQFWLRWHHITGLVAAVCTLTWMFSGLMSMNPFGVFASRSAPPQESVRWTGAPATARLNPAVVWAQVRADASMDGFAPRELERLHVGGHIWYRLRHAGGHRLVHADVADDAAPLHLLTALPTDIVTRTLGKLRPQVGSPHMALVGAYDDLYYAHAPAAPDTRHTRPLPVWRAQWNDGVVVYADAASARILLRQDESNRWQRLLYYGLHRLDFAPLLARPWLRHALVLGLSVLGLALCVTSCVVGWRALQRSMQRRRC